MREVNTSTGDKESPLSSHSLSPVKKLSVLCIRELFDFGCLKEMWVVDEGLLGRLLCEVSIDVSDISLTSQFGHIRWRNLSSQQLVPVDGLEEGMRLDLVDRQTLSWVSLQQS